MQEHECIFAGLARGYCGQGASVGRPKAQIPIRRSLDRPTALVDQAVVVGLLAEAVVEEGITLHIIGDVETRRRLDECLQFVGAEVV